MKKQSYAAGTRIKSFFLMLAILLTFVSFMSFDDGGSSVEAAKKVTEADIKAQRDKIKNATANIAKYQTNAAAFDGQIEEARAEKEKLDLEITYMNEAIYQTDELITQYQTLIAERKTEILDKQAEVERKYDAFSSLLRTSYENGMLTLAELLVSSDNLIEFLTRSDNLGSMLNYQQSLTEDLDAEITGLKALKSNLEQQKQDYSETLAEYEDLLSDLEEKLALQDKYLKKLESDQKAQENAAKKEQAAKEKAEKELQNLIKKYEQQIKEEQNQSYMWPLPVNRLTITSKYGWRKIWGMNDFHYGIDIAAPYGTEIYAAKAGKVIVSTYDHSYGNYVVIDHGGGKTTRYAHMSTRIAKVGDNVKQGQVIGKVGATGSATGYHLHFETRVDGKHTEPLVKNNIFIVIDGKKVDVLTVLKYNL
ncbi:MAG: peptidoglycan DD-metalloendopeptidase family protein [Clostridia bacterium]|nr:peptidoglycan DD-metalloendopeptidase family protein [Clostridia bacterium]